MIVIVVIALQKVYFKDLKEHATKMFNYEKKELTTLTHQEQKFYEKKKVCYIYKKGFSTDDDNNHYNKVRDHYQYKRKYRGGVIIWVIIMIYMFKVTHYFLQMYLEVLEINLLKYMNLIVLIFYLNLNDHGKVCWKR